LTISHYGFNIFFVNETKTETKTLFLYCANFLKNKHG